MPPCCDRRPSQSASDGVDAAVAPAGKSPGGAHSERQMSLRRAKAATRFAMKRPRQSWAFSGYDVLVISTRSALTRVGSLEDGRELPLIAIDPARLRRQAHW